MGISNEIRVLIIEGDESNAEDLVNTLGGANTPFKINLAETIDDGMDKLETCLGHDDPIYDIVLLDLAVEGCDNGVFKRVIEKCKRIPIIVLSDDEEEAIECVRGGAQDYLIKRGPINLLEKAIRYSIERFTLEMKYKQLVESANAAVYELDFINKKFTYVNKKTCDYTGYSKEEFLNQLSPLDLLTPESQVKFLERIDRLNRGEYISNVEEFQIITKNKKKKWALITANYITKKDYVVGARVVALDITSKKERQQLVESIFRTSPVALGVLDYASGKRILKQVNDRMCSMLGYSKGELIGKSARILYPSDSEFIRVGEIKYSSISVGEVGSLETQWKKKDGEVLDILLSTSALDQKEPYGLSTFTGLDITEAKNSERQLNTALSNKLLEWREDFRNRLELHDSKTSALDQLITNLRCVDE